MDITDAANEAKKIRIEAGNRKSAVLKAIALIQKALNANNANQAKYLIQANKLQGTDLQSLTQAQMATLIHREKDKTAEDLEEEELLEEASKPRDEDMDWDRPWSHEQTIHQQGEDYPQTTLQLWPCKTGTL